MGGTLTRLDEMGHERVSLFSSGKQDYTANDLEVMGLILFQEKFKIALKGATFEKLTDSKFLKNLFTIKNLRRQ